MNEAERFLRDQIPPRDQAMIASAFPTAYALAKQEIQKSSILSVRSAEDNHGRIYAWAVDPSFEELIKGGQWKCTYRWAPFAKPIGHYLEILLSHSVLTISQVHDASQQPRDVVFRANKRLNNQTSFDFEEFKHEKRVLGLPHILLVHGYQSLSFVHLGIPNERHSQGYIYRTPNLLNLPHEVLLTPLPPEPRVPPENTDNDPIVILKEELDKWRRENGQ
jgi:hypothetical protein